MPRPKSYDVDTVLGQIMEAFWAQGFDATSISDLTAATGLNRKSLYHEFVDKPSLYQRAVDLYAERACQGWQEILARQPLGMRNLRHFFANVPEHATNKGCLFALAAGEAPRIPAPARDTVIAAFDHLQELLRDNLLAEAPGVPGFYQRCDDMAASAVAVLVGLPNLARLQPQDLQRLRSTCRWLLQTTQDAVDQAGQEWVASQAHPAPESDQTAGPITGDPSDGPGQSSQRSVKESMEVTRGKVSHARQEAAQERSKTQQLGLFGPDSEEEKAG